MCLRQLALEWFLLQPQRVQTFDFSVKEGLTLALTGFNTIGSSLCPSNTRTLG